MEQGETNFVQHDLTSILFRRFLVVSFLRVEDVAMSLFYLAFVVLISVRTG